MLISYKELATLCFLLILVLAALFFYTRNIGGKKGFLGLAVLLLFSYSVGLLYELQYLKDARLFLIFFYLQGTLAATSLFFFLSQHTTLISWHKFPKSLLFLVEPLIAISLVLYAVPAEMTIELYARELPLSKHAIWQEAHNFYLVVILLLTTTLVVPYLSFGTKVPQKAARSVLFATLFPLAALLFFREPIGGKLFQIHMYAFTFSSIVLGAYLFKTSLGNLPLITRDHAVENMNEGWVLLDTKNRIVDVNPSAERILYTSKAKVYGKDAKVIFARWPNIAKSLEAQQEFDGKGSLSIEGRIRYLHVRIFRIQDNEESVSGRLILLRDHTDRRQADAARQDARDEMFSLLHSISGAASRSENINDFIVATMYQLSYSFETKAIAIFLVDKELHKDHFLLVAHQGIAPGNVKQIAYLDQSYPLISQIAKTQQPILIKDTKGDPNIPNILRDAFDGHLLVVPIIDEDDFVGLLLMTRENISFSDDEIIRLEIASRQVGSFVENNRRRHIASTLAERQRLIRDLHDSVTQRLYGLVMMTESARLGISTGAINNPEELVSQLGFDARQALKEMRLFLYKLQPVDIERNGFISSLLHRLEAVEGRAGLDTKLDIDQTVILSLEEQVHLYLIAQEVLNNIIKHANASMVRVIFKKARVNIHLKISDDGKGFDPKEASRSGLGMKNIRERAKIIGAKVKIDSAPGEGSMVSVVVRQDDAQSEKAKGERV